MEDYIVKAIRASLVLTDAYVAGTTLDLSAKYNKIALLLDFTIGSLTTAEYKIEFSPDNTNWYQETASVVTAGVSADTLASHQINATGKYRLLVPVVDRYMKVSVKGTGTMTNSLMKVDAVLVSSEN
jgi:hypothetical protein